ncbi:MAG: fimbrillin family protein [Bacteroidales bacterium]|nr:fimbrillin family protein [Bacteroidales bacterium]
MINRLSLHILLALALASCVKSTMDPVAPEPMVFSAVASHSTKGIITTTNYPIDEPFVVEAVHYDDDTGLSGGDAFMTRETVQYDIDNGLWRTEDDYFWPIDGRIRFYAGSPLIPEVSVTRENGVTANWDISSGENTQTDLCFAEVDEDCTAHSASVPIIFSHALSQVCIKARTIKHYSYSRSIDNLIQANIITVVLDSVKIGGIVSKGRFTQKPLGWLLEKDIKSEYPVFSSKKGQELGCDRYDNPILYRLNNMLLIPQTLSEDAYIQEWHHIVVRTSVTDKDTGQIISDTTYELPKSSVIYLADYCEAWNLDYKYTYRLAVGLDSPMLSMAVTDWTETREIILEDQ